MTLFELNHIIRSVLESSLDEEYWVEGEFADASTGFGGHFYGEMVQKDEQGRNIVARARVTCWARNYNIISLRFQKETGEMLRRGLHVKLLVRVTFHEQYGYALNILDVDSSFTLGDMAKRRKEILARLEQDGIINDNKELPLPRLLRRIAVVSSAGAAGYGDFCNQLEHNDYGLFFHLQLFPAVMQGTNVEDSVMTALATIADEADCWDCVVIIRGGGATGDLSDFDSYPLAAAVAQMPIPVIVGIGHERDETVLDFVAHTRVKTPTAAAAFLIDRQAQEAALLDDLYRRIRKSAEMSIQLARQRLEHVQRVLPILFAGFRQKQEARTELLVRRLQTAVQRRMEQEKHRQSLLQQRLDSLDPRTLLQRGYSITMCGGKVVRTADDVREGEVITTSLQKGEIHSTVLLCKKN
ncbi:MAG: exodeoxyribonuclease VII large subunit [Bacteroidaceae bacterium]|nr:exodeoxyribonuclease VII large subunit [Bacteroidaceae bacterium]